MFHSKFRNLWHPTVVCLCASGTVAKFSSPSFISRADIDPDCHAQYDSDETLLNWSSTHKSNVTKLYTPSDSVEVMRLLKHHTEHKAKLRPVGTALSPNGLGMPNDNTDGISLRNMNDIRINNARGTVTVGAGTTVADLLTALSSQGLTLENFSSIQEQQIGGWTQVAAHGTGISLATVEEQILELKLITPAHGEITLSANKNNTLFNLAKVGLGSLGIVSELTLKCIPKLQLKETTKVFNRQSIAGTITKSATCQDQKTTATGELSHHQRLLDNRHVRYMWIPYTDTVVSVTSTKFDGSDVESAEATSSTSESAPPANQKLRDLLQRKVHHNQKRGSKAVSVSVTGDEADGALKTASVAHLRDLLLEFDPLSVSHVQEINRAEAEYWRKSQTTRIEDSVDVLGFDCGGQQWVLEVCIPLGHLEEENLTDINFVKELLSTVEAAKVPAASPIEQRWTARSTAPMSPAYSTDPDDIFSWVGIILYVPANQDTAGREAIRKAFVNYCQVIEPVLKKYKAQIHWAKIELPIEKDTSCTAEHAERLESMKSRLRQKYPVDEFVETKNVLDPESILSNEIVDRLFE